MTVQNGRTSPLSIMVAVATGIMLLLFAAYVSSENGRRDDEARARLVESRRALMQNHASVVAGCIRSNAVRRASRMNAEAIRAVDTYLEQLIQESIDAGNVPPDRLARAREVVAHFKRLARDAHGLPDVDCAAAFPAPDFAGT